MNRRCAIISDHTDLSTLPLIDATYATSITPATLQAIIADLAATATRPTLAEVNAFIRGAVIDRVLANIQARDLQAKYDEAHRPPAQPATTPGLYGPRYR